MITNSPDMTLRLADSQVDIEIAQRLRYEVFVEELGGDGSMVDHVRQLECDRFDEYCDHLLLFHKDRAIGVYRLMRAPHAEKAGQFYCEDEYDLSPLTSSDHTILELGRSCVAPDYRGGSAVHLIWQGLADYVHAHGIDVLFGVASFHGTDIEALAQPLSYLNTHHPAPEGLRVRSRAYQSMDLLDPEAVERRKAMRAMPALIKAYLRLGGTIGDGAFIDHAFNTTDVLLTMDTANLSSRAAGRYLR